MDQKEIDQIQKLLLRGRDCCLVQLRVYWQAKLSAWCSIHFAHIAETPFGIVRYWKSCPQDKYQFHNPTIKPIPSSRMDHVYVRR